MMVTVAYLQAVMPLSDETWRRLPVHRLQTATVNHTKPINFYIIVLVSWLVKHLHIALNKMGIQINNRIKDNAQSEWI